MKEKLGFFIYDFMEGIEAILSLVFIILAIIIFSPILIWDAIKQRSKEKKENK